MIYPWTELSREAANREDKGGVAMVGHPGSVESWKALWNVTNRCFGEERIA
jgi:hypothetical protein